jgi:SAM-dependent methyltransferase
MCYVLSWLACLKKPLVKIVFHLLGVLLIDKLLRRAIMRAFLPRGGGGIGRRAWLRAMWALRPWGFESPPPHQLKRVALVATRFLFSSVSRQAPRASRVEARAVSKDTTDTSHPSDLWRGFWGIQVLHVGQSLELFDALQTSKTPQAVAEEKGMENRYVELWCKSAESYGFLESTEDGFRTPDSHSDWLNCSKGFTHTHLHLAQRANETLKAVFGGRALPEPQISLRLLLQENLQANYHWLFGEVTKAVSELEEKMRNGGRALEIGCGAGFGLNYLRDYYPNLELFGIEADYECAQEAERTTKAVVHVGEQVGSRFAKGFDLIVCFRTLSAVSDPANLLAECAKLLKPDGFFLLGSETNDEMSGRKSRARIQGERLAYNILAGDHLKNTFTKDDLQSLLRDSGLKIRTEIEAPDWATPAMVCVRDV